MIGLMCLVGMNWPRSYKGENGGKLRKVYFGYNGKSLTDQNAGKWLYTKAMQLTLITSSSNIFENQIQILTNLAEAEGKAI